MNTINAQLVLPCGLIPCQSPSSFYVDLILAYFVDIRPVDSIPVH